MYIYVLYIYIYISNNLQFSFSFVSLQHIWAIDTIIFRSSYNIVENTLMKVANYSFHAYIHTQGITSLHIGSSTTLARIKWILIKYYSIENFTIIK